MYTTPPVKMNHQTKLTPQQQTVNNNAFMFFERLKRHFLAVYSEALVSKRIACTLYLERKDTGQKFVVATGHADCFFEERFSQDLGEKHAYDHAIVEAREFIDNFAFFESFLHGLTDPHSVVSTKFIIMHLEKTFTLPSEKKDANQPTR